MRGIINEVAMQVLNYVYPNTIKVRIANCIYTYESTEYHCRKFMSRVNKGAKFRALHQFKKVSNVIDKEEVRS